MILKAIKKYNLKPSECFMIGDKKSIICVQKIKFEYKKIYHFMIINKILKNYAL